MEQERLRIDGMMGKRTKLDLLFSARLYTSRTLSWAQLICNVTNHVLFFKMDEVNVPVLLLFLLFTQVYTFFKIIRKASEAFQARKENKLVMVSGLFVASRFIL